MTTTRDFSHAMRRKRWVLLAAVVYVLALIALLYRYARPDGSVSLGWSVFAILSMVGICVVAYRSLHCPSCGERLGSLADKVCGTCGAVLTEGPASLRPPGGPTPEVRSYMDESERILRRWLALRRRLRHLPWIVGFVVTPVVAFLMPWNRPNGYSTDDALVVGFVALCVMAVTWLLLIHVVDNLFSILFTLFRGRCPACRAWFTQKSIALPGMTIEQTSLPDFCPSCGEQLR